MKVLKDYINIDRYTEEQLNQLSGYTAISDDCYNFIQKQPSNTISDVYSRHFFEHLDSGDVCKLMIEIIRACKSGAIIKIIVPHWSNPYYYSDPTHTTFYGLYTGSYWSKNNYFHRRVPNYSRFELLSLRSVYLRHKSPAKPLKYFSGFVNTLVNSSPLFQELSEWYLAKVVSFYEVEFVFVVDK